MLKTKCHPEERSDEGPPLIPFSLTKLAMTAIITIFALPILAGWITYYYRDHFHFKTLNHGTLLNPPLNFPDIKKEKLWQIVYIPGTSCNQTCEKTTHTLQQLRLVMGKDANRVKVVILTSKTHADHKIYLVDPIGNVFMYYPEAVNPMDIFQDLKRVLEVSQIG